MFELKTEAGGHSAKKVLHTFVENGVDGNAPPASLILDADGNLYETTTTGGTDGVGSVFELTAAGGGIWMGTLPVQLHIQTARREQTVGRIGSRYRRQSIRHDRRGWHVWRRDGV